jgi:hypothetical protein
MLFVGFAIVAAFGLGWVSHSEFRKQGIAPSSASTGSPMTSTPLISPGPHAPAPTQPFLSSSEWQRMRSAREAVLRDNPDLATEYKEIMDEMQAQQAKLDAAMIKADPKAAAIVAKLVALRQRNGAPFPASTPSPK